MLNKQYNTEIDRRKSRVNLEHFVAGSQPCPKVKEWGGGVPLGQECGGVVCMVEDVDKQTSDCLNQTVESKNQTSNGL